MKVLYSIYAAYSTGFNLVFKILPAFLAAFLGAWEISLVYIAFFGARILIIPAGLTSDRIGAVKTIRLSFSLMTLMLVGFLAFFGVRSLPGWIIFAFFAGIIVNLIEIASASIAASTKTKTTSLFRLESMYQVGVVLGPIAGGFLALYWGIEAALFSWALLNVIGILATSKISMPRIERKFSIKVWDAIKAKKWDFILVIFIGSFMVGLIQAIQELSFPLFMNSVGFDISFVGIATGVSSVIAILGLLYLGRFFEGKRPYASLFLLFLLMMTFPLLVQSFPDIAGFSVLGGIFLVGRSASLNITRGFFSEFSNTQKATLIAFGETVYYFSRSFGSAVAGMMIETAGYSGLFLIMFLVIIVSLAVIGLAFFFKK